MERYCPPGTACFVPANKISPSSSECTKVFFSPKLLSAKVKRFFVISVFMEPENGKTESVNENENKENKNVVVDNKQVRRSFSSVLLMPYNKYFID